jgi:hypothetical protein
MELSLLRRRKSSHLKTRRVIARMRPIPTIQELVLKSQKTIRTRTRMELATTAVAKNLH